MREPVRGVMSRDVICISPTISIEDAFGIMSEIGIRHLPVVEGERLVGLLSDRDLLPLAELDAEGALTVKDEHEVAHLMTRDLIVCSPQTTVAEAAELMLTEKIDSVPVVSGDEFVGLITSSDLLELLIDSSGEQRARALPFEFNIQSLERRPSAIA
jgi:acetoin utilization protein AcuB